MSEPPTGQDRILLQVRDLSTSFFTEYGKVKAVDGVSFSVQRGETLALLGESGCGKSVTALSLMRLVDPPGRILGGEVRMAGRDLLRLKPGEMRQVRGREIAMIFQEPMTSLNPVFTVGSQITEALRIHQNVSRSEAHQRAVQMLDRVGIAAPERRVREYPHQMSGGMKQRVMIAMALVCKPSLLIADEPTTALDVTIQAQILELLRELQKQFAMSILLITHDLGVVAETADRVAVMYTGRIVETADVDAIFSDSRHPYTLGLMKCLPSVAGKRPRLEVVPGQVPDPLDLPGGCSFWPRCPRKIDRCQEERPPLEEKRPGHWSACWVLK